MGYWLVIVAFIAAMEYIAWRRGATLSQRFWRYQRDHAWLRWVMVIALAVLIAHLGWGWP
jgi:hypothetical protein